MSAYTWFIIYFKFRYLDKDRSRNSNFWGICYCLVSSTNQWYIILRNISNWPYSLDIRKETSKIVFNASQLTLAEVSVSSDGLQRGQTIKAQSVDISEAEERATAHFAAPLTGNSKVRLSVRFSGKLGGSMLGVSMSIAIGLQWRLTPFSITAANISLMVKTNSMRWPNSRFVVQVVYVPSSAESNPSPRLQGVVSHAGTNLFWRRPTKLPWCPERTLLTWVTCRQSLRLLTTQRFREMVNLEGCLRNLLILALRRYDLASDPFAASISCARVPQTPASEWKVTKFARSPPVCFIWYCSIPSYWLCVIADVHLPGCNC